MIVAGINGFGRFGLHLLKYWLDRSEQAGFRVDYINDDILSLQDAYEIITNDKYVVFNEYNVRTTRDALIILKPDGTRCAISYTHKPIEEIPWLGKPHILFECSGKRTVASTCEPYLLGSTKLVIIAATSWDADATLVYRFNHRQFSSSHRIISYGSCTVNAYVPLANFLHKRFGIVDSDVYVVHNVLEYRLQDSFTLNRKFCTLSIKGPELLSFLSSENFIVKYTVVPYSGVSMLDIRFRLKSECGPIKVIRELERAFTDGELEGLYKFDEFDYGPEAYNCTKYSAVFIKKAVRVLGENLYLQSYFDTENSANRFFDLANYISTHKHFLSRVKTHNENVVGIEP